MFWDDYCGYSKHFFNPTLEFYNLLISLETILE